MVSAQARFLKQDKKAAREALKEGKDPQQSATTFPSSTVPSAYDPKFSNPLSNQNLINKKKLSTKKHVPIYMQHKYDESSPKSASFASSNAFTSKTNQPKQAEIVDLSSDDDESEDEVHHFEVSKYLNVGT